MTQNNKKGVEMTLNTITIAVLVLIVLLILIFLLMGGVGTFNRGTSCTTDRGNCSEKCTNGAVVTAWSCPTKEKSYCCTANPIG